MKRTIEQHVEDLQRRIAELEGKRGKETDPLLINHLEMDIRSLRLAQAHFELALKLEQEVAAHQRDRKAA